MTDIPWHVLVGPWPLALLTAGLAAEVGLHFSPRDRRWLYPGASALLWVGTGFLVLALATGEVTPGRFRAADGALLSEHRFLGFWVTGVFAGLSLWRALSRHRAQALFTMTWLAAGVTLWAAAWRGIRWAHAYGGFHG